MFLGSAAGADPKPTSRVSESCRARLSFDHLGHAQQNHARNRDPEQKHWMRVTAPVAAGLRLTPACLNSQIDSLLPLRADTLPSSTTHDFVGA